MRIKKTFLFSSLLVTAVSAGSLFWYSNGITTTPSVSETEEGFETEENISFNDMLIHPKLRGLDEWERPEGPLQIALQAGHWKANEAPEEFPNLKSRTGTSGGGTTEWQTNLKIAEETKKLLDAKGYIVEILPATIPPNYYADIFIAIHADGNLNVNTNGFKSAAPRRDYTGKAQKLSEMLDTEYEAVTKLRKDENITRSMSGYYAFNWRRYEHSLHPMTVSAIIETGFLTNAQDRKTIVNMPQKSALGIVNGIEKYLKSETTTE